MPSDYSIGTTALFNHIVNERLMTRAQRRLSHPKPPRLRGPGGHHATKKGPGRAKAR